MIRFGDEVRDPETARRKEFLLVSGDAWCSSSIGGNTRKYHGLLVAERRVYLAALDEYANGTPLSAAQYVGGDAPHGLRSLRSFGLDPPVFAYRIPGATVRRCISFDGSVTIRYEVDGEAELVVRPLVTDRSIHEAGGAVDLGCTPGGAGCTCGRLTLASDLAFTADPHLYRDVMYVRDRERGYAWREDLRSPGRFEGRVADGSAYLTGSVAGMPKGDPHPHPLPAGTPAELLRRAARTFSVGGTLYAGYHWFAEPWGRDAFVSLPWLLIDEGRFREAEAVFRFFARAMRGGLIPNRFPGDYHASDAPLWFVRALGIYAASGGDRRFVAEMTPYLEEVIRRYPHSDVASLDGALITVAPRSTWMDTPATPRAGKPVEVNALWVHALSVAGVLGIDTPVSAGKAARAFARFWNPDTGCLFDIIDPPDAAVRPNQVIAAALALPEKAQGRSVLNTVADALLTPVGLRSLSPADPRYRGRWTGDASYHNGCVWPWLIGFYAEALACYGMPPPDGAIRALLSDHLRDAGLGTISEIFDGDPPHEPRGCISQAWSVGGVLRAWRLRATGANGRAS